ncbi:MAG: deoxynucleoside kinase [Bacteroidales bacterium]|nr:deoxynucleoside kinase [Bacteroidales bacterium]
MDFNYLVIEGNIGAGKTSLARKLAVETGGRLILEQFVDNPFLAKFYSDPDRYAFPVELSFLAERYQQLKTELQNRDLFQARVISDYYLTKSLIFSKNTLKQDELKLFEKLFSIISLQVPRPDLYVYLHASVETLLNNIKTRGRPYEQNIQPGYLEEIQKGYFSFFKMRKDLKILVIDTTRIDFVNRKEDYEKIRKVIYEREYNEGLNMIIL